MNHIQTTNVQLLQENQIIRQKLEQLEDQALKALVKEKQFERRVVIRDLFTWLLNRLCDELKRNHLLETQVTIFSRSTMDINKLLSDYPLL